MKLNGSGKKRLIRHNNNLMYPKKKQHTKNDFIGCICKWTPNLKGGTK